MKAQPAEKEPSNIFLAIHRVLARTGLLRGRAYHALFRRAYFLYKRFYEDPFQSLVRQRPELFAKGHILDVGANIGYTPAIFAQALEPGFRVWAFEPDTMNFENLTQTVRWRNLEGQVSAVHAAVGDRSGEAELWLNPSHPADHRVMTTGFEPRGGARQTKRVPLVRLDDFVAGLEPKPSPVAFIKIDVQGYELPVCQGMAEVLERNPHAAVAFEYCPLMMRQLGFEPLASIRFFEERGYSFYEIEKNGALAPLGRGADLERALDTRCGANGYLDLLCKHDG